MLSKHYAPLTATFLETNVKACIESFSDKRIGLLLFSRKIDHPQIVHQEILTINRDLKEAATNLYAALHILDKLNLDVIIVERLPDTGLGKSINDRLERAAKK